MEIVFNFFIKFLFRFPGLSISARVFVLLCLPFISAKNVLLYHFENIVVIMLWEITPEVKVQSMTSV